MLPPKTAADLLPDATDAGRGANEVEVMVNSMLGAMKMPDCAFWSKISDEHFGGVVHECI
jgi:hypothetical protein